jgi:hypothetical protein
LARRKALPLDSPDWMPIAEAHRVLCSLTGSRDLAAKDLTDAMMAKDEDKRVPAMRRCFAYGIRPKADGSKEQVLLGPERELLPREYWIEHELQSWSDATFVTRRSNNPASIKGYAYYVWKPSLAKVWPAAFAPPVNAPEVSERHKPGPKPRDDWPKLMAAELIHRALYDPESLGNIDALIPLMKEFLEDEIGWAPKDPKEIRKEIVSLLKFVRK